MESIKITKRKLIAAAEYEGGYYFTGNVYNYENIIYYLDKLVYYTEYGNRVKYRSKIKEIEKELYKNANNRYHNIMSELIANIKNGSHTGYSLKQMYYSAGIYGNNGQFHRLKMWNKLNDVREYYLYY